MLRAVVLLSLLFAHRRAVEHQARVANAEHIVLVVLENTDAAVAETLPFLSRVSARGALLRNDHGITHPSQPNYIAMVSGSTQGVTISTAVTVDALHLCDLIERR